MTHSKIGFSITWGFDVKKQSNQTKVAEKVTSIREKEDYPECVAADCVYLLTDGIWELNQFLSSVWGKNSEIIKNFGVICINIQQKWNTHCHQK